MAFLVGDCVTRALFPKQDVCYYYRCPECRHISVIVTSRKWVTCGSGHCGRKFVVKDNLVTQADYNRAHDIG